MQTPCQLNAVTQAASAFLQSCQTPHLALALSVCCPLVTLHLVQEFKLLLLLGCRLVFPVQSNAAVRADVTTQIQFRAADGSTVAPCNSQADCGTVSLMFPAKCKPGLQMAVLLHTQSS